MMNWSTEDEMRFIDGLGKNKFSDTRMPRRKLLENYLHTAECRDNWDMMIENVIVAHAKKALNKF